MRGKLLQFIRDRPEVELVAEIQKLNPDVDQDRDILLTMEDLYNLEEPPDPKVIPCGCQGPCDCPVQVVIEPADCAVLPTPRVAQELLLRLYREPRGADDGFENPPLDTATTPALAKEPLVDVRDRRHGPDKGRTALHLWHPGDLRHATPEAIEEGLKRTGGDRLHNGQDVCRQTGEAPEIDVDHPEEPPAGDWLACEREAFHRGGWDGLRAYWFGWKAFQDAAARLAARDKLREAV